MSDIYKAGVKPPQGTYACADCKDPTNPHTVLVPAMAEKLPECPVCGGKLWYKV